MKPIKANDFLTWLQGEPEAFRSIFQLTEAQALELLDSDKELDSPRSRLAHHLMQTKSKPINSADALLIALERAEAKLSRVYQSTTSLVPILDL